MTPPLTPALKAKIEPQGIYILIACERSQEVCKAFRALGFQAFSCDTEDEYGGHAEWHIKGDAIKALYSRAWDLVIAHPPCTRLANSGVLWLVRKKPTKGYTWDERFQLYIRDDDQIWNDLIDGCNFFNKFVLYGKLGHKISIENPVQHKYAKEEITAPHTQTIEPYQFGHLEKKKTCLWNFGLPALNETNNVYDEMMKLSYAERAKVHYASPGPQRATIRSKTYTGIAQAMADQWGTFLLTELNKKQ